MPGATRRAGDPIGSCLLGAAGRAAVVILLPGGGLLGGDFRGGKGIIDIKTSERNGKVVAMLQVTDADEVMIITNKGMIIRTRVAEVSLIGRNTQGVRLIDLRQEGEKVVGAARAPEEREAEAAAEVAAELAASGHEDDDGSPTGGSEET